MNPKDVRPLAQKGLEQEHRSDLGRTTVVIAAKNFGHKIRDSINSWLQLSILELVVVDGASSDGSQDIYAEMAGIFGERLVVLGEPPRGLAHARQVGNNVARGDFILHAGPDNVMPSQTLHSMIEALDKYDLVSCTTQLINQSGYLNRCHQYSKNRLGPGDNLAVVGTPYVGRRSLFVEFPFDSVLYNSDDTDLCSRLVNSGRAIARLEEPCFEHGFTSLGQIRERWMRWGEGDRTFYRHSRATWSWSRRMRSFLHPFRAEIVQPFSGNKLSAYLVALPFFILVCSFRYAGWLSADLRGLDRRS